MKIKVSKLRKIISEEIKRCLLEADGDAAAKANSLKIASLEKQKNDSLVAAAQHRASIARIKKDSADEELVASTKAEQDAQGGGADIPVTESDGIDEFWPAVARVAGSYAAGKLSDKLLDEDDECEGLEETIKKINGKWCLLSKKSNKNLGCYDDRSGAENRERQVSYFKKSNK